MQATKFWRFFLINFSKNKIICCSIMDAAGLRVLTKQMRFFHL
jgi:hypothetical protein